MAKTIGSREARNQFSQLLGEVHFGHQNVIVKRSGRPMVAIIPIEDYQRLVAEREARFEVVDRIRRKMPNVPVEEVEADVSEAVAAVRAGAEARHAPSRP